PRASYQRHTRLDMDYLFPLCEDLRRDAALRAELRFQPNSSLYRADGRLRDAETSLDDNERPHHLVAAGATSYLYGTPDRAGVAAARAAVVGSGASAGAVEEGRVDVGARLLDVMLRADAEGAAGGVDGRRLEARIQHACRRHDLGRHEAPGVQVHGRLLRVRG